MPTPTATNIQPKRVDLKWNAISTQVDTGRDPVIYYRLDYLIRPCYSVPELPCGGESIDLGTWIEVSTFETQRANNTFVHSFSYVLKPNENFYYRVCPKNGVGFGVCSENFVMLSDNFPQFMYPPVIAQSSINPLWIYVTWSSITTDQ